MSEYTKGPWMIATSCSWRRVMTESGEHVCTPTVQSDGQPDLYFTNGGADGPDARLIAAAPELLEALESVLDSLGALTKQHELLDRMDESEAKKVWAALHKATGRPMP